MPNLTYTNPTLTNPADKTEVQENFSDIGTLLNGGLDDDNVASGASLATSKLAARDYEFLMNFIVRPTTAVAPPTSATIPIACVGLPGDTSDGVAYTVLSGTYIIAAAGSAGSTTFNLELGSYVGGTWTKVGANIVNATTVTGGTETQSGGLTITTASITLHATTKYMIGLMLTALGTSALDEAHKGLEVTLKLRRTSGLRGT